MIDHNILWNIRGTGIYAGDTDNLIIAHNLIGPCTGPGVYTHVATDRHLNGRALTSKGNRVTQNVFYTPDPIRFDDKENFSECNVFADPSGRFNLADWQQSGRDKKSVRAGITCEFEPAILGLRWSAASPLPQFDVVQQINVDYHNRPRSDAGATPGPFEGQLTGSVVLDACPAGISR